MFALSDYYIGLFGFLVENDSLENGEGGWGWAMHLSGSGTYNLPTQPVLLCYVRGGGEVVLQHPAL